MQSDTAQDILFHFLRKNLLIVALGITGMIFLSIGLIQYFGNQQNTSDIQFEEGSESSAQTESVKGESTNQKTIFVDVAGAVQKPGVYELPIDSRIQDALVAAGGLSENANYESIAKNMNQAQKVLDGQKIYVPNKQDQTTSFSVSDTSSQNLQININSATESELDPLPGIGPATAGKIIAGRPYSKIEELLERKIVGSSTFEKIKDKISVF